MKEKKRMQKKIAFFGHFDASNFGNECTLQAVLYNLRRFQPNAEVSCISTGPEATVATHRIEAIPIEVYPWYVRSRVQVLDGKALLRPEVKDSRNQFIRVLRRVCIAIPFELYGWVKSLIRLRRTAMLIIPGTGILNDAYGHRRSGPYNILKWSLIAKINRCKLIFVSVGVGPIYGTLGRYFVKLALSLADFRSYRDKSSVQHLQSIGFHAKDDRVYPDLVFSLPETVIPSQDATISHRPVVGLGVMGYAGKYTDDRPNDTVYSNYLKNIVMVVRWLLAYGYDVRLLIGDLGDTVVTHELIGLLKESSVWDEERIINEPAFSVENLFAQIAATDIVVATRFHNVIFALLCNKPVISISFHHKCESLMQAMGLSDYCLDIHDLRADRLIDKFCDLELSADKLKPLIKEKVTECRRVLEEQYKLIFDEI